MKRRTLYVPAIGLLLLGAGCGPNGDATPTDGINGGSSELPIRAEERPAGTFEIRPDAAVDTAVENTLSGLGGG